MSSRGALAGTVRAPRSRRLAWALVLLATSSHAQDGSELVFEEPIDPARVSSALDDIARDAPPDFCRRAGYELSPDEGALCDLSPAAQMRCPEFAAACKRATEASASARERATGAAKPEAQRTFGAALAAFSWIVRIIGIALMVGLAALCVIELLALLRGRAGSRRRAEPPEAEATPPATGGRALDTKSAPEVHLARARALAAAGDNTSALIELHLGVLWSLDAQGFVSARPGRTNGDYARELATRPELLAAFRDITRAVEAVQFGGGALDASGFARLLSRAAPLLPTLLVTVLLSFGGLGCADERAAATPSAPCGTGADGNSLLCALLEATGSSVQRRYRPLSTLTRADEAVEVLVLLRAGLEEGGSRAIEAWVRAGGVLVAAAPLPGLDAKLSVSRGAGVCGAATVGSSGRSVVTTGPGLAAPQLAVDARCASGEPFIAHGTLGEGLVIFVPTPAALSNASLAAGDNAPLLVSRLFPAHGVVELVGHWTREAPENPLSQVRAAGLVPWVLQLLALGLCFALHRGAPFARRRAPLEVGRRRFSEHAEALGQRWADAGAGKAALRAHASWASEQLRERLPVGTEQSVEGLAHVLAEKTGTPREAVARTLERARRAHVDNAPQERDLGALLRAPPGPPDDEAEHLATIRALGRLLEDIGGRH